VREAHDSRRGFAWVAACLLVCAAACGIRVLAAPDAPPPEVTLKTGALEGVHFGSAENGAAFLGVPYAAPPVGGLRWKPPQPVQKWGGTRKAALFGAACPQLPAGWLPYVGWREDCLYLNVWTTQLSPSAKLPVLVYFHGGSNTAGYSQMTPLGSALAPLGVVVVSANYRLGPLGFLALPTLSAESKHHSSGNYGLLDQIQALKWVQDNISRFGGDPGRVTVMGQSAGAVDTCLLMASPLAAGLFQRAIMESGDCQGTFNEEIRTPVRYNEISDTGEIEGQRLAADLRIPDGTDALKKLHSLSADAILKARSQDRKLHFDAIVDGWIVPEQPAKVFSDRREMRIPVLVGSNSDEATVFGHGGPKTVAEYRKYLVADTGRYADEEFQAYPAAADADVPARYLRFEGDTFAYGAYSMAQSVARANQKVYLYYFTYAETGKRASLGAYHGEELLFLSDSFPSDWEHSQEDEELGQMMRSYWAQFAKTGDPNAPGLPVWPAYDRRTKEYFELGRAIHVHPIASQIQVLERIMNQIFSETTTKSGD
jgi:para-nitrobenzyl esterase